MWRRILPVIGIAALIGMGTPAMASIQDFVGSWKNVDPNSNGIVAIKIQRTGQTLKIRAFGSCSPTPCDWGQVQGQVFAPNVSANLNSQAKWAVANYTTGFSKTTLVMSLQGNQLVVESYTQFTDGSGRTNYMNREKFKNFGGGGGGGGGGWPFPWPMPGGGGGPGGWGPGGGGPGGGPGGWGPGGGGGMGEEDCISFNPDTTHVAFVSGRWKIVDGDHWILDFGGNAAEANQAMAIIQYYHFNKQCFVGRPDPGMTYWLKGHNAPNGAYGGEDCVDFDPNNVSVEGGGGNWRVVDGGHSMFSFPSQDEANQAVAVIQNYNFRYSCFVGRPGPSMTYLRK